MDEAAYVSNFQGSTPASMVRLALGRARTAGLPFDEAWSRVVGSLRCPDRAGWLAVLEGSRDAYKRAFERSAATPAELALSRLAGGDELVDLSARRCEWCGREMAAERDLRARYHSDECRVAAWRASRR